MVRIQPVVLTIAGFDPSSGAGITADIKTIAAHGGFGISCITALTVQSTQGVREVAGVSAKLIAATLETLVADFDVAAVHVGMLANAEVAGAVADFLAAFRLPHLVVDPVLKSSSGAVLLDSAGRDLMLKRLIPLAEVLTPNVDEAADLAGVKVTNIGEMGIAANRLHDLGVANVVITGGHLERAIDLLSVRANGETKHQVFEAEMLKSRSTHGTGCAFSTALACNLALGMGMAEAAAKAKRYAWEAILHAQPLGKGKGPLNHFYGTNVW